MMNNYPYPSPVIAERIQKIFDDNKLTDGYVAKILGYNRKTVLSFRNATTNPSVKFIRWICSTYHVTADWLLDLE